MDARFPQSRRLKKPEEFQAVFGRKHSVSNELMVVYSAENGREYSRIGLSVSKKVGNAVARNRFKRLFREAFRLVQHEIPQGYDLVVIPRAGSIPTLEGYRHSLLKLLSQSMRRWPRSALPSDPVPPPPVDPQPAEEPRP